MSIDSKIIEKQARSFTHAEGLEVFLGTDLPYLRRLQSLLAIDMGGTSAVGIGWWEGELALNAIVADYIYSLPRSIEENVLNAFLHLEDIKLRNIERIRSYEFAVQGVRGSVQADLKNGPNHYLNEAQINTHCVGFFRAIGSALDCMAALVIGICAIEKEIVTSGFSSIDVKKLNAEKGVFSGCESFQKLLFIFSDDLSWIEYVSDLRNTYVHRSRRLHVEELKVVDENPRLLSHRGFPILRSEIIRHLPAAPFLTDVETMGIYKGKNAYLNEDYLLTLDEAYKKTFELLSSISVTLPGIWSFRKDNKIRVSQCMFQWNTKRIVKRIKQNWFTGFVQKDPFHTSQAQISGEVAFRMQSAGLTDEKSKVWDDFLKLKGLSS